MRNHVLVMVANYWGIGTTSAEAFSQIKKVRGSSPRKTEAQVWLACAEGTSIDGMGCTSYPQGSPRPIEIYIRKEGRAKRAVELDRRTESLAS